MVERPPACCSADSRRGSSPHLSCEKIKWFLPVLTLFGFALLSPLAWGQLEIGRLTGTVADSTNARISTAQVTLENPATARKGQTLTDPQGQFRFDNVPYGDYLLRISAPGFSTYTQKISIHSSVPGVVAVRLNIPAADTSVTVAAAPDVLQQVTPRSETVLDENSIKFAPTVARRDELQALIASTPGWASENDGILHVRGIEDGTLYVVGGVPTPDRVDGLFAGSFNIDAISSLNIIAGNIPAEYGNRAGAVVIIQPKSGLDSPLNGTLSMGGGSFGSADLATTLAGGTTKFGLFFAGSSHRSDRFLDPVDPRNFNNIGGDLSLDLRADLHANEKDLIRLAGTAQGADFHVPNNVDQEAAGQRQTQEVRHNLESIFWTHVFSPNTLSDVSYYRNYFSSELLGSPFDTPLTATQNRHLTRQGMLADLTHATHGHTIKMGMELALVSIKEDFGFAVTDPVAAEKAGISEPARAFTPDNPFRFFQQVNRGTEAAYIQDDFSPLRNLNVNLGVRYDHSNVLVNAQQVSPRIGAVYYVPRTRTAFRASFNRLYMPPMAENLLIASSEQARALSPFAASGGGADVHPETLSSWEVGFNQEISRMATLNVAYWWRYFHNIDDPNVLLGTTILFPNTVYRADAKGVDVRLELAQHKGFTAFISYTNNQITETGPINGGLFLDDEFIEIGPGTRFSPDQDQRNIASFGVTYTAPRHGLWTTFSGKFESGVPIELPDLDSKELHALPGAELVNFDTARVKPWYVFGWSGGMDLVRKERFTASAQLDVQNLANRPFVFNWGNPFSGTHFGYPALFAGRLKFSFGK